jgi:hypothetical protein
MFATNIDHVRSQESLNAATAPHPCFYDLLIRDDPQLDNTIMDEGDHVRTIQRLLAVSAAGAVLYGAAVGLTAQFFAVGGVVGGWLGNFPLLTLPIALTCAFLIALLVCLPSFYFYTQLSGLDASFRLITAQALRVQARTSVLLLGVLPVYAAVVLAAVVGVLGSGEDLLIFGVTLPFVVGLAGLVSLYRSFKRLSEVLPVAHTRRPQFLSWMVIAWAAVYSAVCPIALYRIGEALAKLF